MRPLTKHAQTLSQSNLTFWACPGAPASVMFYSVQRPEYNTAEGLYVGRSAQSHAE